MKQLTVQDFGTLKNGEKAHLYIMENDRGTSAAVTDYGAALVNLRTPDKNGTLLDVVLGFDDVSGYENGTECFGASVGRSANRIGGASIEINGIIYKLAENDHGNNLHSGPDYYFKRMWTMAGSGDDHVTFVLHSPDGDQGYPGALDMYVTYTLDEENGITVHYESVPDKVTVINMTNHSYFNLNGQGSGTALGHTLTLDSDFFTPADGEAIPTGEILPVDDTPMDFRAGRVLGADIDSDYEALRLGGGYDHNWILKTEGSRFIKVAELAADKSGIIMEMYTDRPGVQIYTANFLEGSTGKGGACYRSRDAVCLETHFYPDAVHHENFPGPVCLAGEKYDTRTMYRFRTDR